MTRQTRKTINAIFDAFSELLNEKKYSRITMQEIADRADVGRSTVYSHFETKEDLLKALCSHIFDELLPAQPYDFTAHENIVQAVLLHIKENRKVIMGLFSSEGMDMFIEYSKEYFQGVLEPVLLSEYQEDQVGIPKELLLNHMIATFVELLRWWVKNHMKQSPEEIEAYYMRMIIPLIQSIHKKENEMDNFK